MDQQAAIDGTIPESVLTPKLQARAFGQRAVGGEYRGAPAGEFLAYQVPEFGIQPAQLLHLAEALAIGRVACLLYTSDAADERSSVDLGGRRIIKKKQ